MSMLFNNYQTVEQKPTPVSFRLIAYDHHEDDDDHEHYNDNDENQELHEDDYDYRYEYQIVLKLYFTLKSKCCGLHF